MSLSILTSIMHHCRSFGTSQANAVPVNSVGAIIPRRKVTGATPRAGFKPDYALFDKNVDPHTISPHFAIRTEPYVTLARECHAAPSKLINVATRHKETHPTAVSYTHLTLPTILRV